MFRSVVLSLAAFIYMGYGGAVLAGGSVVCTGVVGSHEFFRSASWAAYYGTQGKPGELVVTNNSSSTIFFQYWSDAPSTNWDEIAPKSSRIFEIRDDQTVTQLRCSLASGTAPPPVASALPARQHLTQQPDPVNFVPAPQTDPVVPVPQADPVVADPQPVAYPVADPVAVPNPDPVSADPQAVPVPAAQPGSGGGGLFPHPYADPATTPLPPAPGQGSAVPVDPDDFGGVVVDVAPENSTGGALSGDLAAQILLLKK